MCDGLPESVGNMNLIATNSIKSMQRLKGYLHLDFRRELVFDLAERKVEADGRNGMLNAGITYVL